MKGNEKHQIHNGSKLWGGREENSVRECYPGNFSIYSLKRYCGKFQTYTEIEKIVKRTPMYLTPSFNNYQIIIKHFANLISSIFPSHISTYFSGICKENIRHHAFFTHKYFSKHFQQMRTFKKHNYYTTLIFIKIINNFYSKMNSGPPKDIHSLIPGICEYVTLHGERDFAGM